MNLRVLKQIEQAMCACLLVTSFFLPVAFSEEADHAHEEAESENAHVEQGGHAEEAVKLTPLQLEHAGVTLTTAAAGTITMRLELPGQILLNGDRVAHVVPRVDGTVQQVRKGLGDEVKAGETLAVLESRELADLSAAYLAANARVSLALLTLKREEGLWREKISPEQDYLGAKQALAEAQIEQRQALQKLKAVGLSDAAVTSLHRQSGNSLARYEVTAPLAGTVIEKHVTLGETVTAADQLFTLADLSSVWVDLSVYARDLAAINKGQTVRITVIGVPTPAEGVIDYVQPLANTDTRAVLARIVLDNRDGRWRPGLTVTAEVQTSESPAAVVVAKEAVQSFEGRPVVFVESPAGLVPRPVKIGREDLQEIEILHGLTPGERYVVSNSFVVKSELSKGEAAHEH